MDCVREDESWSQVIRAGSPGKRYGCPKASILRNLHTRADRSSPSYFLSRQMLSSFNRKKAGCILLPSGFHQLAIEETTILLLVPSSNRVSCNIRRSSTNPLLYSSVSRWQNVTAFSSLFFIPRYFFSALHFVVLFDGFFG